MSSMMNLRACAAALVAGATLGDAAFAQEGFSSEQKPSVSEQTSVTGETMPCGQLESGHQGVIPEWPNEPVDFKCQRGFSEVSLCILNRQDIDWLRNAGPQFVAIHDGQAVYALTRDEHPAYPMIVRREVKQGDDGSAIIQTTACGFGDKAASDQLIEDYKKLDADILEKVRVENTRRTEAQ